MGLREAIRESWIRRATLKVGSAEVTLEAPTLAEVNELDARLIESEPEAKRGFALQFDQFQQERMAKQAANRPDDEDGDEDAETPAEGSAATPDPAPEVLRALIDNIGLQQARGQSVESGFVTVTYESESDADPKTRPWTSLPAEERFSINAAIVRYRRAFLRERARLCLRSLPEDQRPDDDELDHLLENDAEFLRTVKRFTEHPPEHDPPSASDRPT